VAESQPWNLCGLSLPWLVTLLRWCINITPCLIESSVQFMLVQIGLCKLDMQHAHSTYSLPL